MQLSLAKRKSIVAGFDLFSTDIGRVRHSDIREEEEKQQQKLLKATIGTIKHYFGSFSSWLNKVIDPRDSKDITYPLPSLLFAGIWMFVCRLGARRQIGLMLRNGPSRANFAALFGVETFPHGDTLNDAFRQLSVEEMQEVVCALVEMLIRKKALSAYRLFEQFYIIAVDGTATLNYHQRHCPHCLTRTHNGKTTYYHNVLEAKLVTPNGFAFSLMSEFIENPGENPAKQDCELKAFYRLAKRLKERFPRLPIILSLDGLFAGGPTFTLCRKYHWHWIIVLKDDDLSCVNQEFAALRQLEPTNGLLFKTGKEAEIKQQYHWVNDISYLDSESQEHSLCVLECLETKPVEAALKTTKFKWITDFEVRKTNVVALANGAGRMRWKIENEGFNVQKNGGFELEHAYTKDPTAAKIFYFLLQIAHILSQLLDKGSLLKKLFPAGFGSVKNLAFRLLEAWRNTFLSHYCLQLLRLARFQIRFDSS